MSQFRLGWWVEYGVKGDVGSRNGGDESRNIYRRKEGKGEGSLLGTNVKLIYLGTVMVTSLFRGLISNIELLSNSST